MMTDTLGVVTEDTPLSCRTGAANLSSGLRRSGPFSCFGNVTEDLGEFQHVVNAALRVEGSHPLCKILKSQAQKKTWNAKVAFHPLGNSTHALDESTGRKG